MSFARKFWIQKHRGRILFAFCAILLISGCKNPFFSSKLNGSSPSGRKPLFGSHGGGDGSGYDAGLEDLKNSGGSRKLGPSSTNGKIVVTIPRDRCKAGTIVFGNVKCQAVGRGLTRYSNPGDRRYKQGAHSNGRPCWYLDTPYENGATPSGRYTLGAVRPMGSDKRHWGQAGIRINDNNPRTGFVIHSVRGFLERTNAEVQNGYGCVRISQECISKLHEYRSRGGAGQVVEVNEI